MNCRIYVTDCRYTAAIKKAFGQNRVFLPSVPCPRVAEPVACHPDMVLCPIGRGRVLCAPDVYEYYHRLLTPYGILVIKGKTVLEDTYPGDIAYHVLMTDDYAFCKKEDADPLLLDLVQTEGKKLIRVSQGYTRCSSLYFRRGIITADPSIKKAAEKVGLSLLFLSPGHIRLPGYDTGFIGGASGLLEDGLVAFCGSLSDLPQKDQVQFFIESRGGKILDIPEMPLTDTGTILGIDF